MWIKIFYQSVSHGVANNQIPHPILSDCIKYYLSHLTLIFFYIRKTNRGQFVYTDITSDYQLSRAGRSSEVEHLLMVWWVVGSILHGVDPLNYFLFQPVLHNWCNKGCGMCYPVCGMVHIKEPLLLIDKSSLCGGSGFLSHYQNGP